MFINNAYVCMYVSQDSRFKIYLFTLFIPVGKLNCSSSLEL